MSAVPPLPKSFEDAARRDLAVAEELERVCGSTHFRTSRRSCEFLRYIVRVTLDGRMDSLKERSIGIDLFGRDSSYEPSSDATVRVRANEVRKRLSSYYTSSAAAAEFHNLRIELPTGSYVPRFLPVDLCSPPLPAAQAEDQRPHIAPRPIAMPAFLAEGPAEMAHRIPPIQALTLMRPALLALLVCTLLLRHQLENREGYMRFWDRLLAGRSAMILSIAPQDKASLVASLYPLVWIAGRYGVDASMQGDSLAGSKPEAASTVQVRYVNPAENFKDPRLRWVLTVPAELSMTTRTQQYRAALLDRNAVDGGSGDAIPVSSAALLTILPEDASTLHIQGTDPEVIRRLLEALTVERNFPAGLVDGVERLDSHHALQMLVFRNAMGEWNREIFWGDT